jgi:hypothetical protein
MYGSYCNQIIARQRMDEAAKKARTASQRHQIKTAARWHFPKVSFPSRPRVAMARPA